VTEKWDEGLGPWSPVFRDTPKGRLLYGRGSADDGYAVFCATCVIQAIEAQGAPPCRCHGRPLADGQRRMQVSRGRGVWC
jgi:acetylornithine deacetylase/succinyl-diaminopimelate desuccinylase-like protein